MIVPEPPILHMASNYYCTREGCPRKWVNDRGLNDVSHLSYRYNPNTRTMVLICDECGERYNLDGTKIEVEKHDL